MCPAAQERVLGKKLLLSSTLHCITLENYLYIYSMGTQKSTRNKLAGTKKGTSESAKYFQKNPSAREKKKAYDKAYHSTPERKEYRAKLNKANRDSGTYGNGDGKDMSHSKSGKVSPEKQSSNRARNGKGGKASKK